MTSNSVASDIVPGDKCQCKKILLEVFEATSNSVRSDSVPNVIGASERSASVPSVTVTSASMPSVPCAHCRAAAS